MKLLTLLLTITVLQTAQARIERTTVRDLFFGEALYYAYQERYFDAIRRYDAELEQHYRIDEPERDPFIVHRGSAEFGVGDMELSYRMHQKAGRALNRLLSEDIPPTLRNDAAYRLARIYFEKGDYIGAQQALDRIKGEIPEAIADNIVMLRGQVALTQRNYESAISWFQPVRSSPEFRGYATYNYALALMLSGKVDAGVWQLDRLGDLSSRRPDLQALRDKANLVLGKQLLDQGYPDIARPYFERIDLGGRYSSRGLLNAGWSDLAVEDFERALVPWTELRNRDLRDIAVHESLLALPYTYGRLGIHGRAALLYGQAIEDINTEVSNLDRSVNSVLDGDLLNVLDQDPQEVNASFFERLRDTEEAPETRYLSTMMARHSFQQAVQNYRDLGFLYDNLGEWLNSITAFQNIIQVRRNYYEPMLPAIEEAFEIQDSLMKHAVTRRDDVLQQLEVAQQQRDSDAFATPEEIQIDQRLAALRRRIKQKAKASSVADDGLDRVIYRTHRLQGVLDWQQHTDYDARLDHAHRELAQLNRSINQLENQHARVVRFKREAYQSFEGYDNQLRRTITKINALRTRILSVKAQQGRYLEKVTVNELDLRRENLANYISKARFAMAESYDRATKKQSEEAAERILEQIEGQPPVTDVEALFDPASIVETEDMDAVSTDAVSTDAVSDEAGETE